MTKGEESRQRLIKCAAELFWKNGYSATGISQILRQTGFPNYQQEQQDGILPAVRMR